MSGITIKLNKSDTKNVKDSKMPGKPSEVRPKVGDWEYKDHFEFGFRKLGDSLLDVKREVFEYSTPQDVFLTVLGTAFSNQKITDVDIKLDHDDGVADAKIISGAIGSTEIEILITVRDVQRLRYDIRLFGTQTWLSVEQPSSSKKQ